MKNMYAITDKNGRHLCYQVAKTEKEAISFARMYNNRASKAKFIREA